MEVISFIISIKKAVKWNLIEDDAALFQRTTIQFRAPSAFAQSNSKATIQFNEPEKNAQMFEFRRFRLVKILQRRVCVRGEKRESLWTSPLIWNYPECNSSLVICQENYSKQVSVYWQKLRNQLSKSPVDRRKSLLCVLSFLCRKSRGALLEMSTENSNLGWWMLKDTHIKYTRIIARNSLEGKTLFWT